jgi:hypothetical protein
MTQPYLAATIPAKTDYVSGTTLFRVAMDEFGDPLQWGVIAALNNMIDPWITAQVGVLIPPVAPMNAASGIYVPSIGGATAGIVGSLPPLLGAGARDPALDFLPFVPNI